MYSDTHTRHRYTKPNSVAETLTVNWLEQIEDNCLMVFDPSLSYLDPKSGMMTHHATWANYSGGKFRA